MRSAIQGFADVACQGADIGAFAAYHSDFYLHLRKVALKQFYFVYDQSFWLQRHFVAAACHFVCSLSVHLAQMTVEENLKMGAYTISDARRVTENMERVYGHFPRLKERRRQMAGTLSGGEQQMLATGRALMTNPRIVLMDEPSMGLSPLLVKEIFAMIQELHESGITILLVEQNAKMALAVSDRAYVLETGTISMEGAAADLAEDDRVRKAYLGA